MKEKNMRTFTISYPMSAPPQTREQTAPGTEFWANTSLTILRRKRQSLTQQFLQKTSTYNYFKTLTFLEHIVQLLFIMFYDWNICDLMWVARKLRGLNFLMRGFTQLSELYPHCKPMTSWELENKNKPGPN